MAATRLPRRFRSFSLRTLMVLVTVVCVMTAWLMHEWQIVIERKAMLAEIENGNNFVVSTVREISGRHRLPPDRPSPTIPWYRRLLGDSPVELVAYYSASDRRLSRVREVFPEATVTHIYNVMPFHPPDDKDPWPWVVDVLYRP